MCKAVLNKETVKLYLKEFYTGNFDRKNTCNSHNGTKVAKRMAKPKKKSNKS